MGLSILIREFSTVVFLFLFVTSLGSFQISILLTLAVIGFLYWFHLPPASQTIVQLYGAPYIIAHRGAGFDAPENTLAAVKWAKENGATAVEFDVDYTADGVAVVFHDSTVDRCTDGIGKIGDMTLEQVKLLNASTKHTNNHLFPNERIPTLDEMVELCLANDLTMFIDVKSNVKLSTEKLLELFDKYPDLYSKAVVCSFNPLVIYSVRSRDRKIVGGLTHRSHYLTRKVDKTESEGPWWKKLIWPFLDLFLQWSHYCWLWYLCGNSVFFCKPWRCF